MGVLATFESLRLVVKQQSFLQDFVGATAATGVFHQSAEIRIINIFQNRIENIMLVLVCSWQD